MHSMKVRIVKETSTKITLYFFNLNRSMPVTREDFEKRVASGMYDVVK